MLIIFDCDGVLVDSEALAAEVFSQELGRCGIDWTADDCLNQFKGRTLADCMEILNRKFPGSTSEDFLDRLNEATRHRFERDLEPVEGVLELLNYLHARDVSFCVASNGGYTKMRGSLQLTGLLPYFEGRCYSAESVSKGKPDPELFLWAADSMGVPPQFCKVIEDSESGLRAAKAAGMAALHYCAVGAQAIGCSVFSHMSDLPELLESSRKAAAAASDPILRRYDH